MERVSGIAAFRLVSTDLDRLVQFYVRACGFEIVGERTSIAAAELERLGLSGDGVRQELRLGRQTVTIDSYAQRGRSYPIGGDAASPWFQHFALVTTEIRQAYARLGAVTPISTHGPETLPPSSGGVTAFKFRDPEGHPLELLQFEPGSTPEAWRGADTAAGSFCLGVDHSAISVSDLDSSLEFYGRMGLSSGGRTVNKGVAQERLDGIANVTVDVVAMSPKAATPHLELLGYRSGNRDDASLRVNDVAATRFVWHGERDAVFTDPDGHWHEVCAASSSPLSGS